MVNLLHGNARPHTCIAKETLEIISNLENARSLQHYLIVFILKNAIKNKFYKGRSSRDAIQHTNSWRTHEGAEYR